MSSAASRPASGHLVSPHLARMADALRLLILQRAQQDTEDVRTALIAAPVITLLLERFITHEVQSPDWPNRDRLIFSAASLSPLLCPLLHLLGQPQGERQQPQAVRCDLHPQGLDVPLARPGHGLAAAVGMALAARLLNEEFGADIIDHATWVLADDDDFEPGVAQEAIAAAPSLRPQRLVVVHFTARRPEDASAPAHLARLAAAGWRVRQVAADDLAAVAEALAEAHESDGEKARRPAYVAVEYDATAVSPSLAELRQALGMEDAAEQPSGEVCDAWRLLGLRGRKARKRWQQQLEKLPAAERAAFQQRFEEGFPAAFRDAMRKERQRLAEAGTDQDMPALFQALWRTTGQLLPGAVRLCSAAAMPSVEEEADSCTFFLGQRTGALVALLAGMAAHGGLAPCGHITAAELPAALAVLQEAAAARLPFTLVVEDDGTCATQRWLEALPPPANVMRPGDAVELVECWQIAMQAPQQCNVLALPRMRLPLLRTTPERANFSRLGAYELLATGEEGQPCLVLMAAGWPLAAAAQAAHRLAAEGNAARVISIPALAQLAQADDDHRARLAAVSGVRIGVCAISPDLAQLLGGRDVRLLLLSPCDDELQPGDVERLARAIAATARQMLAAKETDKTPPQEPQP